MDRQGSPGTGAPATCKTISEMKKSLDETSNRAATVGKINGFKDRETGISKT